MDEDVENYLPDTQSVDDRVLKDVLAYVEVRCGFENRSKAVSKQLELLGANISNRLTKEVTHVIWKDGKPSTYERAVKWGIHILSVLWVDSCRQNQQHVAESLFQVKTGDDGSPIIGRLKRLKSMQPKLIEDQIKKSSEKFAKRKKRKADEAADIIHRPYVFAAGSPFSPMAIHPKLSTPDTPNSMRCALEALDRAKKSGTDDIPDSPVHGERSIPLHKRLFSATASSDDVSDYGRSSPAKTTAGLQRTTSGTDSSTTVILKEQDKKSGKLKSQLNSQRRKTLSSSCSGLSQTKATRRSSRRCSVMKEPVARLVFEEPTNDEGHTSESSRNLSPVFSKNSADSVFDFYSETTSQNNMKKMDNSNKMNHNKTPSNVSTKSKLKRVAVSENPSFHNDINSNKKHTIQKEMNEPKSQKRKRSGNKTKQGKKILTNIFDDDSSSSGSLKEMNKTRKKRRLLAINDFGTPPLQLMEPSASSASDSADSICEQVDGGVLLKKKKDETKKATVFVTAKGLGNSVEEFHFKRRNMKQRKTKKTTSLPSGSSSSSDSISSSEERHCKKNVGRIQVRGSSKEKAKRTLCMTSLSQSNQGLVISIIRKLGDFEIVDTVCESTTHVILGRERRTLNVLAAIARGCWLLSLEWVLKSLEDGVWLPEEPFEQHELYPSAQLSRLEHCASGGAYRADLFSSFSPMFISDDTTASADRIQELVEWCGGHVCSSARNARLGIGKTQPRGSLKTVDEKWVYDCINELQTRPLHDYSVASL
ncbi:microcephalin-like [Antedon mediterranea]|uniref:microcephalin-like n=1 Tax=Antedon mediterranea TaxID=105859 RepID=UPI003AF972A9